MRPTIIHSLEQRKRVRRTDISTQQNINGEKARENFVEGQEYLRGKGTDCDVSASNECERVSCSNNAAVYLCTTDGKDHFGVECPMIADYIDHIFDKCQHDGQYDVKMACGTQENTDGWRVEVGMNAC